MWSKSSINQHEEAAKLLGQIMTGAFEFIRQNKDNVTEYDAQQFIIKKYEENHLISDAMPPIVAFGKNTCNVHYFPEKKSAKKLEKNDLIMIDIWAKLGGSDAPYADITWMGYFGGSVPDSIQKTFDNVISARDLAIEFIRAKLKSGNIPTGREIDNVTQAYFISKNLNQYFPHTTGHSLGFANDHGHLGVIGERNKKPIKKNAGYTIEPGIYFEGKFGVRSEIDFLINDELKVEITTPPQREIIRI